MSGEGKVENPSGEVVGDRALHELRLQALNPCLIVSSDFT